MAWIGLPLHDDAISYHGLVMRGPLSVVFNVVDKALYYAKGVLDVASCAKYDVHNLDHVINLLSW